MAGISFLFPFCWWSSCRSQTLLESLIIPGSFGRNAEIGETPKKTLFSQPKAPSLCWLWRKRQVLSPAMVGIWVLSDICTGFTWGLSSAGRGAVPQPWMFFIPGQGRPGHPFPILPVTAASWCSCACVCVTSPGHPCWLLFDWENGCSESFQGTFRSDGRWKDKWKKGSANKDMFLTWLRVLFSFLPAEPWVTAAVLLRWESSECSSCFFPKHV